MDREKSLDEILNQAEAKDWLFRAERDMFPKMKASALSMVISSGTFDAKLALEVGAAILFDKPLIVVVIKGSRLPDNLRRIASAVVEIDDFSSQNGQEEVRAAIEREIGKKP